MTSVHVPTSPPQLASSCARLAVCARRRVRPVDQQSTAPTSSSSRAHARVSTARHLRLMRPHAISPVPFPQSRRRLDIACSAWTSLVDVDGSSSKLGQGAALQISSPPAAQGQSAGSVIDPRHRGSGCRCCHRHHQRCRCWCVHVDGLAFGMAAILAVVLHVSLYRKLAAVWSTTRLRALSSLRTLGAESRTGVWCGLGGWTLWRLDRARRRVSCVQCAKGRHSSPDEETSYVFRASGRLLGPYGVYPAPRLSQTVFYSFVRYCDSL